MGKSSNIAARLAVTATLLAAVLIVLGILFSLFGASSSSSVVVNVLRIDRTLVHPFASVFVLQDARLALAINWGLGAAVYVIAGQLVGRLLNP